MQDLVAGLPLKEKAAIANLDENKEKLLQYTIDVYLEDGLVMNEEMSKDVTHRIREVCQKTNGVRCLS